MAKQRQDNYQLITDTIIGLIETHGANWTKPWTGNGGSGNRPISVSTGKTYKGCNPLLLWAAGFNDHRWGTYNAWKEKGAQVRSGEKGTKITFFKALDIKDKNSGEDVTVPFLRVTSVFNAEQVDGVEALPAPEAPETPAEADERVEAAIAFAEATSNGKNAVIELTGTITGNVDVTVPTGITNKVYIIKNSTSGAHTVTVKVSGQTGVTAEAKTYALLSSEYATDQTYSVRINNKTTGSFIISNTSVLDAVDKINSISGSTGVTASATTDNKVRLYSDNGSDILVENESTGTALRVQAVGHDGTSTQPSKYWHHATSTAAGHGAGALDGTYTIRQLSTGQEYAFTLASSGTDGESTVADIETSINGGTGLSGFKVVDNPNQANTSSAYVTAAEGFGDFEIYSGTDTSVVANKQSFAGYGTVVNFDNAGAAAPAGTASSAAAQQTSGMVCACCLLQCAAMR